MEEPRYAAVLRRFRETQDRIEHGRPDPAKKLRPNPPTEAEKPHELGPLPQPKPTAVDARPPPTGMKWPVEPHYIDPKATKAFSDLGVSDKMVSRLAELGINDAFAIQAAVIPALLQDYNHRKLARRDPLPDVLVNSFTGSGKTLAYCVPIVESLRQRVVPRIRALVLLPTRPLMLQVHQTLEKLVKGTSLRVMSLRADRTLSKEREAISAHSPDIVISTPGRLVDHVAQDQTMLSHLQFLVLDEADRLVSQSFQDWTQALATATPAPESPHDAPGPQRLVFSATLTRDPGKLAALQIQMAPFLPRLYVVGASSAQQESTGPEFTLPTGLHEQLWRVKGLRLKPLALVAALVRRGMSEASTQNPEHLLVPKTLVFVHSNEAAVRLARLVTYVARNVFMKKIAAEACSGEMSSGERRRALRGFVEGRTQLLVCTDLIARGIDVEGVALIVNYDLPLGPREYVHRVGRTARAGTHGDAWTLAAGSSERKHFWTLQNSIARPHPIQVVESPDEDSPSYDTALKALEADVYSR